MSNFVEILTTLVALIPVLALLSVFVFSRRLWNLHEGQRLGALKVIVSNRKPEETGAYDLPVTGVGQLLAFAAITPSLVRSYGWRWREPPAIRSGTDAVNAADLGGNLILLGGVSRNYVTRELLRKCEATLGVQQRFGDPALYGDRLFWRDEAGGWEAFGGTPRRSDGGPGEVHEDYALILRMPNPWDEDRRKQCVVFAGVHTYGTGAAARFFVRQWWKPKWWGRSGMVAVIRVQVEDGHAVQSELIRFRRLR